MPNDNKLQKIQADLEAVSQRQQVLSRQLAEERDLRARIEAALIEVFGQARTPSQQQVRNAESITGETGAAPLLLVKLVKETTSWKSHLLSIQPTLSSLTAIAAIIGLVITIISYRDSIDELNATTVYTLAKEARTLTSSLSSGEVPVSIVTNYYFSVYYLRTKQIIDNDIWPFMLADFCAFVQTGSIFAEEWKTVEELYPPDFQQLVNRLQQLSDCSTSQVQEIANAT